MNKAELTEQLASKAGIPATAPVRLSGVIRRPGGGLGKSVVAAVRAAAEARPQLPGVPQPVRTEEPAAEAPEPTPVPIAETPAVAAEPVVVVAPKPPTEAELAWSAAEEEVSAVLPPICRIGWKAEPWGVYVPPRPPRQIRWANRPVPSRKKPVAPAPGKVIQPPPAPEWAKEWLAQGIDRLEGDHRAKLGKAVVGIDTHVWQRAGQLCSHPGGCNAQYHLSKMWGAAGAVECYFGRDKGNAPELFLRCKLHKLPGDVELEWALAGIEARKAAGKPVKRADRVVEPPRAEKPRPQQAPTHRKGGVPGVMAALDKAREISGIVPEKPGKSTDPGGGKKRRR
jgi:hypothetical protein